MFDISDYYYILFYKINFYFLQNKIHFKTVVLERVNNTIN